MLGVSFKYTLSNTDYQIKAHIRIIITSMQIRIKLIHYAFFNVIINFHLHINVVIWPFFPDKFNPFSFV